MQCSENGKISMRPTIAGTVLPLSSALSSLTNSKIFYFVNFSDSKFSRLSLIVSRISRFSIYSLSSALYQVLASYFQSHCWWLNIKQLIKSWWHTLMLLFSQPSVLYWQFLILVKVQITSNKGIKMDIF